MSRPSIPTDDEITPRKDAGRRLWLTLVVVHRYLGVALGLLMLLWFASGIVMMYAYYFRFQGFAERDPLILPVYRIVLNDGEGTRYYLNPATGQLLLRVASAERGYRWLFSGLHRWDFTATLRSRPLWDMSCCS